MNLTLLTLFGLTFATSVALTPLVRRVGMRLGMVDRPRPGELQRWVVARTGGYALIGAFAIGVLASLVVLPRTDEEWTRLVGFGVGLAVVVPVAYLDDRLRLGPRPQLIGQLVAAALPIPFGLYIADISSPWGEIVTLPLLVAVPFTLIWTVGMINTINWLDTMDGLAGGITSIAALVLLVRTVDLGQYSVAVLPLALMAAAIGFLPYNFNPARIIMGTSGSMFLGYALALLAIFGGAKIATALMVLGLPIVDTALVIVQRLAAGRSPFRGGDSAHLVHRLARRGWGVRRIALTLYTGCLVLGLGGLYLPGIYKAWVLLLGVALIGLAALALSGRRVRLGVTPR